MENIDYIMVESLIMMIARMIRSMITIIIWVFIIKLGIELIRRKNNRRYFKNNVVVNHQLEIKGKNKYEKEYIDVSKDKLAEFNTEDINSLKDYFYNIFLEFENAYNNLDYNMMKILTTKQMYQNYYTGISLDLKVGRKRIIRDIEKKKVIVFELDSTIAKQIVSTMIEISYINYTIDKDGYVINGSRDKAIEKFEVTFRKDFERQEVTKCPSCGASVVGNRCDWCRSKIKNVEFKISSIRKIIEE